MIKNYFILEKEALQKLGYDDDYSLVIGIDEVGRGCLAGPVVASALVFRSDISIKDLSLIDDSKKLSIKKRNQAYEMLSEKAFFKFGVVDVEVIDKINILQASLLAMNQALNSLLEELEPSLVSPKLVLVDGRDKIKSLLEVQNVIQGDQKSVVIAAASIVAKVYRDKLMSNLGDLYPHYFWDKNAGYGTKKHLESIQTYGITKHHRRSFAPIKKFILSE